MGFLTRNDDVFLLDSASVTGGNDVTITEKRSPDDNPMLVEVKYYPAANSRVAVDFQWNTISAVRRHRGDNIDFSFVVDRTGEIGTGDLLALRFPVRSDRIWDEVFCDRGRCGHADRATRLPDWPGIGFRLAERPGICLADDLA